jgi:long-chain fatty acid transport protein
MTMRKLIVALLLAPAAAFAGGYAIPNENARSIALSQADVAAQTGPEAAYQNAAALAGQIGFGITGNLELIYNQTTWTNQVANIGTTSTPTGSSSLKPHANFPPMVAMSYGDRLSNDMAWGLGIAFMLPGGGSLYWPDGWQGAGRIQSVDQKVYLTQFSGGFEPLPGFKVGASFLWYRITESLEQQLSFGGQTANAMLGLAGNAYTFGVSGEYTIPNTGFTLGVDYRHQAVTTIDGAAHFDNVPPSFVAQLQDQGAHEDLTVPNQLFIGGAYKFVMDPGSDLRVMATFTLERWVVYKSDTYVGDKGLVITVPRDYRNAQVYRFGGEYTHVPFFRPLTLRLGFERSISDQPTDTISPTLTDGKSWVISAGAGFNITKELRFDVGYQYAIFNTVTATGTEAFPGSYDTHVNIVSAGLTWQPGKLF